MSVLDRVNSPKDLKKLNDKELEVLCEDIRELLINTVSKTGGHLASNLGVVELTVAMHKVFNSPVCPNCHAMLHRGNLSISELKEIIKHNND